MKIAIIGAMEEEVNVLRNQLENRQSKIIARSEFTKGTYHEKEVILLKSGIGKVNAAMTTSILLHTFQPDVVINTGVAGGYNLALNVGDIVISTEVRHHDVDATVFGYEYGQVPQMPAAYEADSSLVQIAEEATSVLEDIQTVKGLIVTGDSFIYNKEQASLILKNFPSVQAVEMEGAAIAQVAWQFNVPFVVIRSLSDIAGKESHITYDQFVEKSAQHSATLVLEMIKKL